MTDGWAHVATMASPVVDAAGAYPPAHLGIIFRRGVGIRLALEPLSLCIGWLAGLVR